ncbi:hypothetical protein GCM10017044_11190 [Kordiimonas sediminis]|uniref:Sulfotransferase domain-containing protein n=1 Tax=Kordiimonas sediminis TaxID=1735581 RepID=A0A919APS0_9PROT|nr:hypothetical protein [Kordiimonas sediminis]GHF18428.1 hypothetical protein GCM10017044_11190 [Kordiimonas sediminis]
MPKSDDSLFKKLVFSFDCWKWPTLIKRFEDTDVLVMDQVLFDHLPLDADTLQARHVTPDAALSSLPEGIKRVFVFALHGEWAQVKALRSAYPEVSVYSMIYQLGPSCAQRPVKVPVYAHSKIKKRAPIVILSTPGSDVEFLARTMEANGLPYPKEYFGKALMNLVPAMDHFNAARYLDEVLAQSPGQRVSMIIQTDVWKLLQKQTSLSARRMQQWLKETNAKVIYFSRRDKMMQAAIHNLMARQPSRSPWDMIPKERKELKMRRKVNFHAANLVMHRMVTVEERLERFTSTLPHVKMISLEELVESPARVIEGIAQFIGQKPAKELKELDYGEHYRSIPNLESAALSYRRELIDRLGLHVNMSGSLVTKSDELIHKGKK